MAVRLLAAATAAICLACGALTASAEPEADQGRIAFTTDRAPNLRRLAIFSVRENGASRRMVEVWPHGAPPGVYSPDRKRILFVRYQGADAGLFIASRTGANARRLTPAGMHPDPTFGLAFSPDGKQIAFAGFCAGCHVGSIFVIRSNGTRLRRVAVDARSPTWSPDGRRLAYTGDMFRGPIRSVYVVGLDGKRSRRLGQGANPVWAPGGNRVAYITVGQSDHKAFCVASVRRPRGRCFGGSRPAGLSWSPTGRRIALLGYRKRNLLALVRPDGRGLHVLTRDFYSGIGWSPDGRRIAYVSLHPGGFRISLRNAYKPRRSRLLAAESPHAGIGCCSFRHGRVVYSSTLYDNDHEVAVMNADGSGFRALTSNFDEDSTPAWSPDGRSIAYSRLTVDYSVGEPTATGSGLRIVDEDGSNDRPLTRGGPWHDTNPSWSPDGRQIAFLRTPLNSTDRALMILDLADGSIHPVHTEYFVAAGPVWSSDGQWIAYSSDPFGHVLSFVHPDGTRSYWIEVGGSPVAPAWAPDGSRIAYGVSGEIRTVRPDGSGIVRVVQSGFSPTWSPDSQRIAFSRTSSTDVDESDIWIASAFGGAEVQVTQDPSSNTSPAWRPGG